MGTAMADTVEAPCLGDGRVRDVAAVLAPGQSAFLSDLVDRIAAWWPQTHLAELVVRHSARGGALDPLPRSVWIGVFAAARLELVYGERRSATVRAGDRLGEAHESTLGARLGQR